MNQQINYHQTASTPSILNLVIIPSLVTIMLETGSVDSHHDTWVNKSSNFFAAHQYESSFSEFPNRFGDTSSASIDFVGEITDFYSELVESQQPLGREFEEIWDANAAYLYES